MVSGEYIEPSSNEPRETEIQDMAPIHPQLPCEPSESNLHKVREFIHQHRTKLAIGAAAVSAVATLVFNPLESTLKTVEEEAPPVLAGMVGMEAMWLGGAAMMVGAIGGKFKNPRKIKAQIPSIAEKANDSKLFKAGFWINTTGAVGEFVIPAVAVSTHLPPESWGLIAPSLLDLGITIAVRRTIRQGIRDNIQPPEPM